MVERDLFETDKFLPVLPEGSRELYIVRQFVSEGSGAADLRKKFSSPDFDIDSHLAVIRERYSIGERVPPERNPYVVAVRVAYLNGQLEVSMDRRTGLPIISKTLKPMEVVGKLKSLMDDRKIGSLLRASWTMMAEGYIDRMVALMLNDLKSNQRRTFSAKDITSIRADINTALGVNRYGFALIGLWYEALSRSAIQRQESVARSY